MSGSLSPERVTVIVIAKEPRPGLAKTRLAPALGPEGAARVAEAALADTLEAVAAAVSPPRRLLALDGSPGPWLPPGFRLRPQRGDGLGERLAAAFEDAGGPSFLIGMDTPQVGPERIVAGCELLCSPGVDAALGLAEDGGWWGLGLRAPDARAFAGVPMSEAGTGAAQVRALEGLGLRVAELERLRDVDTIADARAVAALAPGSRFQRALATAEGAGAPEAA